MSHTTMSRTTITRTTGTSGCDSLVWPRCDGLIWPHVRLAGVLTI